MSSIHTYQVLLEVANLLKELQSNPEVLKQQAKDAFALSKTAEDQLKDAHKTILEARAIAEEQTKQQIVLNSLAKDLADKEQELQKNQYEYVLKVKTLEEKIKEIEFANSMQKNKEDKFNKEISIKYKDIEDKTKELERKEAVVSARHSALDEKHVDLETKYASVSAYETKLKAHAAKLKAQADTIL